MAKIAQPTIPLKTYRHFAIITLALTALIALFASGENREAMADQLEQPTEQSTARSERNSAPQITRRDETRRTRFDGGDRKEFGRPMVQVASSQSGRTESYIPPAAGVRTGTTLAIPGYSRAYLDSLTEEEYQRLVANLQRAGAFSEEIREQNQRSIEAISRQRSGAPSSSDGAAQ